MRGVLPCMSHCKIEQHSYLSLWLPSKAGKYNSEASHSLSLRTKRKQWASLVFIASSWCRWGKVVLQDFLWANTFSVIARCWFELWRHLYVRPRHKKRIRQQKTTKIFKCPIQECIPEACQLKFKFQVATGLERIESKLHSIDFNLGMSSSNLAFRGSDFGI